MLLRLAASAASSPPYGGPKHGNPTDSGVATILRCPSPPRTPSACAVSTAALRPLWLPSAMPPRVAPRHGPNGCPTGCPAPAAPTEVLCGLPRAMAPTVAPRVAPRLRQRHNQPNPNQCQQSKIRQDFGSG